MAPDDLGHERVDLLGIADVGRDELHAVGQRIWLLAAADDDTGPIGGKSFGDPTSDAATATGDQHDLAVEVELGHGWMRLRSRGKIVVSRMFGTSARRAIQRSQPIANPPCGGIPNLNVSRYASYGARSWPAASSTAT